MTPRGFNLLCLLLAGFLLLLVCDFGALFRTHYNPIVAISDPVLVASSGAVQGPAVATRLPPHCQQWHIAQQGDTQWLIAGHYAQHNNRQQWLKSMRWVSGKAVGDERLQQGESVCVNWDSPLTANLS